MEKLRVYKAYKEKFVYKIRNKKYSLWSSLNFDYGRLIGMLDILMIDGIIDCEKYNREVNFLDELVQDEYWKERDVKK